MNKIIFALALSISVCYSSDEVDTDLNDTNKKIETCFKCHFSCIIRDSEYDTDQWIKNKRYEQTVLCVIPKCIADCYTYKGEFAQLENIDNKEVRIIEFSKKPIKNYTQSNYNALVLYNYIAQLLHTCILECDSEDELSAVGESIKQHYKKYNIEGINKSIDKAVSDIRAYVKALQLTSKTLTELCEQYKNEKFDNLIHYCISSEEFSDILNVPIKIIYFNLKEIAEAKDCILPFPSIDVYFDKLLLDIIDKSILLQLENKKIDDKNKKAIADFYEFYNILTTKGYRIITSDDRLYLDLGFNGLIDTYEELFQEIENIKNDTIKEFNNFVSDDNYISELIISAISHVIDSYGIHILTKDLYIKNAIVQDLIYKDVDLISDDTYKMINDFVDDKCTGSKNSLYKNYDHILGTLEPLYDKFLPQKSETNNN